MNDTELRDFYERLIAKYPPSDNMVRFASHMLSFPPQLSEADRLIKLIHLYQPQYFWTPHSKEPNPDRRGWQFPSTHSRNSAWREFREELKAVLANDPNDDEARRFLKLAEDTLGWRAMFPPDYQGVSSWVTRD